MKTRSILLIAGLALLAPIAGCGAGNEASGPSNNSSATTDVSKESSATGGDYLQEKDFDAFFGDADTFKGKQIQIVGRAFSVDADEDSIAIQAWYDVDESTKQFLVYAEKATASDVHENDFIKVDGEIAGLFTGENLFGGKVKAPVIKAKSLEVGGYDDLYAPAEDTKTVGETKEQYGIQITLDRIEYAKDEARVYIDVTNSSGANASVYTMNAKAIQDGQQFEHEDNFHAESADIGELLDGTTKSGVARFKGLAKDKPVSIHLEAFSDNWEIHLEDFVFEVP